MLLLMKLLLFITKGLSLCLNLVLTQQSFRLTAATHCVLIPRDPNFIYAYWDYTQEDIDQLRNQLKFEGGDSQLVLRVYDITRIKFNGSNANHTWDLEVGFSTKNWYIHVWQDNANYCAELGINIARKIVLFLWRGPTLCVRLPSPPRNGMI